MFLEPQRTYIFTFLLSSRVFIPPHDLLARVGQICLEQRQQLEAGSDKARLKSFSAKIVQLLKEWTEAFPYDFQDEKAMAELKAITHRVTQCDEENGTVKKAIAQMTQSLLLSLAARSQLQELREKLRSPAMDKGPILKAKPPAAQKDILGVCCDPLVLAQQLTHIELERVSSIHPEDLMQIVSHMDSRDKHRCRGDLIKTYSLEAYDNWFNCLSMLVATEVCRVVKKKHRTRMLEFFIDVARECFNIGNFNSMMAIICECAGPRGSPSSTVWPISSRPDPSCRPPRSWHEPQSCGKAEENLVQSQDGQVRRLRGRHPVLSRVSLRRAGRPITLWPLAEGLLPRVPSDVGCVRLPGRGAPRRQVAHALLGPWALSQNWHCLKQSLGERSARSLSAKAGRQPQVGQCLPSRDWPFSRSTSMVSDRLGGPGAERRVYSLDQMYLIRESSFCKCVSCGAGQVWEVSVKAQGQRKVLKGRRGDPDLAGQGGGVCELQDFSTACPVTPGPKARKSQPSAQTRACGLPSPVLTPGEAASSGDGTGPP
nr:ras-GEF domain-containing family member 1A isoform X3 [Globicephala melas]